MLTQEDHADLASLGWYDLLGLAYRYIYLLTIRYLYNIMTVYHSFSERTFLAVAYLNPTNLSYKIISQHR